MTDKNTILAIVLSAIVLIAWQYFVGMPQQQARQQQQQSQQAAQHEAAKPGQPAPATGPQAPGTPAGAPRPPGQSAQATVAAARRDRAEALKASPRVPITTDSIEGSIALKGGRIDDVSLVKFHETVDPEIAADRPAVAVRQPRPVLCRVRLDRRRRRQGEAAGRRHAVDAGGLGRPHRRPPGDARLRQWRGPHVPPHHRGRRQVPVHRQGRGRQQERQAGHALSLRPDLAPRHAQDRRLLHPARGPGRLSRQRGPAGIHLQEDGGPQAERQRGRSRSTSTSPTAGSASPTNIGRRRCCRRPATS